MFSELLVSCRDSPKLLELSNKPFNDVSLTVALLIKPGSLWRILSIGQLAVGNDWLNAMFAQIGANFSTVIAFIASDIGKPFSRSPRYTSNIDPIQQRIDLRALMGLTWSEDDINWFAIALTKNMNFGREASAAKSKSLFIKTFVMTQRLPVVHFLGSSRGFMSSTNTAIDCAELEIDALLLASLCLELIAHRCPDTLLRPAPKTIVRCRPWAIIVRVSHAMENRFAESRK